MLNMGFEESLPRFPFAFPCRDINALTVMSQHKIFFILFGTPAYVYSDRVSSFMSYELGFSVFGWCCYKSNYIVQSTR